ncbi:DUF3224 domain-containing protein [Massilia glaciei]|nr:DUF3224 domain-containing protein [Massilia glaciei]
MAKGSFSITLQPPPAGEGVDRLSVGRMLIDKRYLGDLEARGQGEMLSAGNPSAGSAAYVAIEHVTGVLGGRKGSFALQHAGTMHGGVNELTINVVPGSGTGELAGIVGQLKLDLVDRTHCYTLDYTLE